MYSLLLAIRKKKMYNTFSTVRRDIQQVAAIQSQFVTITAATEKESPMLRYVTIVTQYRNRTQKQRKGVLLISYPNHKTPNLNHCTVSVVEEMVTLNLTVKIIKTQLWTVALKISTSFVLTLKSPLPKE